MSVKPPFCPTPGCTYPGGTSRENHDHALEHMGIPCLPDCPMRRSA